MGPDVSLIVIAKAPVAGRAKTRLIPDLGPEGAAAIAEACLGDTLAAVAGTAATRRVLVLDGEPGAWLPDAGFEIVPQRSGGLDRRLAGAFADARTASALLVGMDTPQLTPELLGECAGRLASGRDDAVIGGAPDGGYWAIGFRELPPARAFEGVPMSAPDTGERQRQRLHELGLTYEELPELRDVDTIDSLRAVAAAAPQTRCAAALARLSPRVL